MSDSNWIEETVPVPHPIYCPHGRITAWRFNDEGLPFSFRGTDICPDCHSETPRSE